MPIPSASEVRQTFRAWALDKVLTALLFGAAAGFQALKNGGLPPSLSVTWGIVVAAAVLMGWNAWLQLRERERKKREDEVAEARLNPTPAEIEAQINQWSWKHEISAVREGPAKDSTRREDFRISVKRTKQGPSIEIVKPTDKSWLAFVTGVEFETRSTQGKSLDAIHKRVELQLRLELLRIGIDCQVTPKGQGLTAFILSHTAAVGELGDDLAFVRKLQLVERGVVMVETRLQLSAIEEADRMKLRGPKPSGPDTEAPPSSGGGT